MGRHLLLSLRLYGDEQKIARFHGTSHGSPEWPPSPARVFQALVAGVARGNSLPEALLPALEWLEALPPPVIAAPRQWLGQSTTLFVPNNDTDKVPDPRDVSSIRTKKIAHPNLFSADQPILYAWSFPDDAEHARALAAATSSIYQLGRGVDMAWAVGEVLDDGALEARLEAHPGIVRRPSPATRGERMLACPTAGSLASLEARHHAAKLVVEGVGKASRTLFTNPPKPRFVQVTYERARRRIVFELRDRERDTPWPWAPGRIVKLVEKLRDAAAARLRAGLPGCEEKIERTLIGRKPGESGAGSTSERVRILPLPSIGFVHADRGIRRFALDVPSGAPLPSEDIEWAFSGLECPDPTTGELSSWVVTRAVDESMFRHYVGPSRRWYSVTAVALPEGARRRRIEPSRRREEAKTAEERRAEESRAIDAVRVALRHAEVRGRVIAIHVQREPFEAKGGRAEAFAEGTRFVKERLWHVALEFERPIEGPLVIGDGRYLGLGILAPRPEATFGVHAFRIEDGLAEISHASVLTRALRRAVMARVQHELGHRVALPPFFSGHGDDGAPVRSDREAHLAFAFEPETRRLFVIAPCMLSREPPSREEEGRLRSLDAALDGFRELLAGAAGRLILRAVPVDEEGDTIFGRSKMWRTVTPYVVTRHGRNLRASEALALDVRSECRRAHLPTPQVEVEGARGVSGLGLVGHVKLTFDVEVRGPILLGRDRHFGGGLFCRSDS